MIFLAIAAAVTAFTPSDTARLTELRMVVDARTWNDVKASSFLPEAYGPGFLAGPAEVRLCDRLSCLVFVPEDSAAGVMAGDLVLGVLPVAGSALASHLEETKTFRTKISISREPDAIAVTSGEMPLIYFLQGAAIAVEEKELDRLANLLRSAGASVFQEGEGIVVKFSNQVVRLLPGWGGTGPEQLDFYLRRETPGNPTYKFGAVGRFRFGPGRNATWVF